MKRSSNFLFAVFLLFFAIHSTRADLIPLHNTGEASIGVETNYVLSYAYTINDTEVAMTAYGLNNQTLANLLPTISERAIHENEMLCYHGNEPPGYRKL